MSEHSWDTLLTESYTSLSSDYRQFLEENKKYFPSKAYYLNAFKTLARQDVKYILFGQDPYPRLESVSGYAFIDAKVKALFSPTGLSKEVNKASSLRNFIKMLLIARKDLISTNSSQEAISHIDKSTLIDSIHDLRENFEKNGVLLLNTALVFTDKQSSNSHTKEWRPFMRTLLKGLEKENPKLILFGNHAKALKKHLPLTKFQTIELEHPYNHTFIENKRALKLFEGMKLLDI
ncbi:MAG: uracil-DNA glycosylase [Epsilonproteobacteria bacterium]|nr:MAG: uracil-DNA glycosylase [Campylobacterota bacterium]